MSGRSINSRLQVLEERLIAERPQPQPQRPRMEMRARTRPRNQLELSSIPAPPVSQASIETEAKIREIYKMSGLLTINDKKYRSEISDLQHLGELGNGTCGHVVKMLHKPSGTIIAVKQMRRSGNSEENKRILMDLEVVLRSHGCPYIVRCLGYFITEADVWICMELMASCFDKILKRLGGPIPENILGNLTVATVSALSYLKVEHDVIHRDVKPSNILIDERGVIKLCDFGISGRLVDSKAKTRGAGCAAYMAPERINPPDPQKPDYDIRADVWSLGITLVELATGRYPYRDCTNDFEVLSKVIEEAPPALPNSPEFSEDLRCFVKQCLIKDYRNRPKYVALLEHPFVKRVTTTSACVGSWLASALPPGSPRLSETPPVFRRIYQLNNAEESNPSLNGLTLTSFSFNTNNEWPIQSSNNATEHLSNSVNSINKLAQKTNCEQNDNMTRDNISLPNMDNLNVCEESTSSKNDNLFSNELNIIVNSNEKQDISTNPFYPITTQEQHTLIEPIENISKDTPDSNIECAAQTQNETPSRVRSIDRPFNSPVAYSNNPERWPYKHTATAPNTKNYFANLEIRNQPFSGGGGGGGGGPSSFENYTNPNRRQELMHSQMRSYGSPEVNRKQYFSPSRNRVSSTAYEHGYQDPEPTQAYGSPTNLVLLKNDGCEVITAEIEPSPPPCFRQNGPTNYFTATSVCTMSRYSGAPIVRNRSNLMYGGSYHQNPGGSCSQPASLEAYGDTRQISHGYSRTPEKSFSPPLWSPQPAHRWAVREQEERERDSWRNESNHHQQGNTSPIVLQRFYHQQGQRRSRRDWDSSSRQSSSSLSRDTSVGRSPEPPRRTHRDPSLPRDSSSCKESPSSLVDNADLISYYKFYNNKTSAQATEHPLLREWRERERTPSKYKSQCELDGDRQPDLIKPYRADGDRERCFLPPDPRLEREKIVNEANAQFESKIKKSTYHHHMREEQNGDCYKVNPDAAENHGRSDLVRKNSREKSRSTNERKNERISADSKEENSYNLHILHGKHGKSHGKDRDEQGWLNSIAGIMKRRFTSYVKLHLGANNHTGSSRSSSPSGVGGSGKASRLTPLPRRVATTNCDDINKRMQDCSHNFVRVSGVPPQPPPRRTTDSWSLPASPLPTRPF